MRGLARPPPSLRGTVKAGGWARAGGGRSMRLTGDPALQPRRQAVVAASGKRVVGRVVVRPHQLNVPFSVPLRPTGGVCTVTFTVSPTAVPATVLGTGDTRELGIRFQNVVFRPS